MARSGVRKSDSKFNQTINPARADEVHIPHETQLAKFAHGLTERAHTAASEHKVRIWVLNQDKNYF